MSAARVLGALQPILPPGTKIAQTVVQRGISTIMTTGTPGFPALILNAPHGRRERKGIGPNGPYQWTHQIHAIYLNRWEAGSRSFEQILVAADADLDQMIGNVSENITLTVAGVDNCMEAGDTIDKHLDQIPQDMGLGFPVVSGYLIITVLDFWETWTPA